MMGEKLEKYQVFIFLILIILIMAVIKVKYGEKTIKNYELSPSGDRQITNEEVKPTATPTINKDYPLEDKLPYQGKGFVIDKYFAPNTLNLKLTTATQTEAAKEIGVWLDSFGELGSGQVLQVEESTNPSVPLLRSTSP